MLLFKLNLFAAGDGKLAAAFAAALLPSQLLPAVIYTLVIGGVLALFYLVKDRLICQYLLKQSREKEKGLPYGVAIAIGFYLQILVAYY